MIAYQTAATIPSTPPRPAEGSLLERMARTMVELSASRGSVDREDLILAKFTSAEIAEHAAAAGDLAILMQRGLA